MGFEWLKFAHVVTIIAAVGLAEGPILPALVMVRRRDVVGIRKMLAAGHIGDRAANVLTPVAIIFGILAALAGEIDLTAPWLLATYAILAGAILLGAGGGFRHLERLEAAANASPENAPSAELEALIRHPWTTVVMYLPPALMGTVVGLMVIKPQLF